MNHVRRRERAGMHLPAFFAAKGRRTILRFFDTDKMFYNLSQYCYIYFRYSEENILLPTIVL